MRAGPRASIVGAGHSTYGCLVTTKLSEDTAQRADRQNADWRREHACSGITTGLILAYAERVGGRQAVEEILDRAGLAKLEQELRVESAWFSYDTKIALWGAAEEALADPKIAEHVGESVLEFSIAPGLKHALQALGSPDLVYRNVVRANSKFNWAHELVMVKRAPGYVRLRYRDVSGVGYHRYDCEYTRGLLGTVPELFGLPPGRVTQSSCVASGDDCCEFDVRWVSDLEGMKKLGIGISAGSLALLLAGFALDPALAIIGAGLAAVGGTTIGVRAFLFQNRRIRSLEARVREQDEAADHQLASLAALSSDLRLGEVLKRITENARNAIGGKEFALVVREGGAMRADRHSGVPEASLCRLEKWTAEREGALLRGPIVIEDLTEGPLLAALAEDEELPLGSCCAVALVFREEFQGALIALAHGPEGFLPADTIALSTYAAHASIALANARLLEQLERQAAEDPLTGLNNARAFQQACAVELARARRDRVPVALIMLDLDHFKAINDAYGHPYGDEVLCMVADVLRSNVRPHDTVARLGGEEFAALLLGASTEEAFEVAERMRTAIASLPARLGLSTSVGIAVRGREAALSYDALLAEADEAMYAAKRNGRDRTSFAVATPG
jgi:diguanylate cyclase (GGDEF)-like protein